MKENLTDSSKSKESKRKRNNKKTGKRKKRLESICSTRSTTIEKEKLNSTGQKERSNSKSDNKIEQKLKEELESTRKSKREEKGNSLNAIKPNKRDCWNK